MYEERSTFLDLTYESFLNYEKTWNETHKVKGTLGASVFERKGQSLNGVAFGIPNNSLAYADISAAKKAATENSSFSDARDTTHRATPNRPDLAEKLGDGSSPPQPSENLMNCATTSKGPPTKPMIWQPVPRACSAAQTTGHSPTPR